MMELDMVLRTIIAHNCQLTFYQYLCSIFTTWRSKNHLMGLDMVRSTIAARILADRTKNIAKYFETTIDELNFLTTQRT